MTDQQRTAIRTRDLPWPQGPWETPAVLRERPDAEQIECQAVVSGRWKSLSHPYWDDCVIPVRWGLAPVKNGSSTPTPDGEA